MAVENSVNGSYGIQQPYGHAETYPTVSGTSLDHDIEPPATLTTTSGNEAGVSDEKPPTKEEIGWYFVEQYYKTLCNEPGKLNVRHYKS